MWCCSKSSKRIIIMKGIQDELENQYSVKYGISIERYRRIIRLPNMSRELMETMYNSGYDFADTKLDLPLFANMQTFE